MEAVINCAEDTGGSDCPIDLSALLIRIRSWAAELGFAAVGVSDIDVGQLEAVLAARTDAHNARARLRR